MVSKDFILKILISYSEGILINIILHYLFNKEYKIMPLKFFNKTHYVFIYINHCSIQAFQIFHIYLKF